MLNAVFLDYDTVSNGDLDASSLTRVAGEVRFCASTSDSEIRVRIGRAQVVLLNKVKLSRERLEEAPDLKLIALAATGTDNIDLRAAKDRNVAVCNVRAYCTSSVAQHAWSLILSLTQHLSSYAKLTLDGTWGTNEEYAALAFPIRDLSGRTLGIIGWGELGRAVAHRAEAFGMRVAICSRPGMPLEPGRVPLDELLRTADVVSLHTPSTPQTKGMIGARELALMKPDALLINTARGALVDSRALAAALKAGRLGGAGIDVLPQEPPTDGDPLLEPGIPNLIVTPHIAWAAREARQRCLEEMASNIEDFLNGGRRGRVV